MQYLDRKDKLLTQSGDYMNSYAYQISFVHLLRIYGKEKKNCFLEVVDMEAWRGMLVLVWRGFWLFCFVCHLMFSLLISLFIYLLIVFL